MNQTLRAGIIGCGGIANQKHLPSLKQIKSVEIAYFCDIIIERAEKAAEKYGMPQAQVCTNYKQILSDTSIDVIYVLTPNHAHCAITVEALEAGKHVLCEKPMAISYADAQKMLQASKKSNKKLTIGYQYRYGAECLHLKKLCARGDLGEIYFAKAHAIRRRAVPTWGVFLDQEKQGGGALIDIGTHALDMTLFMMDNYKPASVKGSIYKKLNHNGVCGNAFGPWNPSKFTVEDSAFGFITMENDATIILESSWALNTLDVGEAQTTLCGTKAGADMKQGLRINGDDLGSLYTKEPFLDASGVAFFDGITADPALLEAQGFIDSILNDTQPYVMPEQAIVVSQILEGIYESASTGELVIF